MEPHRPLATHADSSKQSVYKVPRRFDLAMAFVVTFAFAVLLSGLNWLGAKVSVQVGIMLLLTIVGAVEMFVPHQYVRMASVASGQVFFFVWYLTMWSLSNEISLAADAVTNIVIALINSIIFGSLAGYMAGTVVAGVFLMSDYVRIAYKKLTQRNH